jgi:hypothetical protein
MASSDAQVAVRRGVIDWLDDNHHFGEAESLIGDDEASFLDKGVLDSLGKIVRYVIGHPEFKPVA